MLFKILAVAVFFMPLVLGKVQSKELNAEKERYFAEDPAPSVEKEQAMQTYQQEVAKNESFLLHTGVSQHSFDEDILAYIRIPRIDIEYPIRYGTTDDVLNRGMGVLENSSLPIGGVPSHSVIVGHRGYRGIHAFFRNLDEVLIGDMVEIVNRTDSLYYRVNDTKIISPSEGDVIRFEEGKDQITIFTCHPYMINNKRLLVFAERIYP